MTRDMELIRKIVSSIQSRNDASPREVIIADEEEWKIARHLELLLEAGFIEALVNRPAMGHLLPKFCVVEVTMAGHDFAAAIENEDVWTKLKKSFPAAEFAKLPLKVVQSVGAALLLKWAETKAGL
jgi:hypothetical protein